MSNRAGYYVSQGTGYKSFVPNKLPPNPPISFDQEIISLLSQADRKLGRLDGVTSKYLTEALKSITSKL